jgi:hypothetical protein
LPIEIVFRAYSGAFPESFTLEAQQAFPEKIISPGTEGEIKN